tara:strand:+ start:7432 stop:7872 length:441 start_codon:yes stop_codon:yes gene_type:complete
MDGRMQRAVMEEDIPYIISIYVNILNRIGKWVPASAQQRLKDQFDVEFFAQLLRHRQFDWKSLHGLTNTTFQWIHDLQMPVRDTSTEEARQRVLGVVSFAEAVETYVQEVDKTLTLMEKDIGEFIQNKDHPVVQNMLNQAMLKLNK